MRLAISALLVLLVSASYAEMMGPNTMPADRVIKNLEAKLKKNPKDGPSEYLLGRTYYSLYCARDPRVIRLYGTAAAPQFPSTHTSPWEFKNRKTNPDSADEIANAKNAILHLKNAIRLGGGEPGLFHLTLACAYEATQASGSRIEAGVSFKQKALSEYEASFMQSRERDVKRPSSKESGTWESWISIEACAGILRLDPNSRLKADIETHVKKINSLPPAPITPLIFSLNGKRSLNELLDSGKVVSFDLDGTGAPQRYTWVKPETAFLVWQPKRGTAIRSGQQLFGSATWWLMPRNAYEAMSLLDDNSDGWLTGLELESLAAWSDLNQNGISELGEVVSVGSLGINALRTSFTGRVGESYVCQDGLKLSDGRVLPTYDWVTRPTNGHRR